MFASSLNISLGPYSKSAALFLSLIWFCMTVEILPVTTTGTMHATLATVACVCYRILVAQRVKVNKKVNPKRRESMERMYSVDEAAELLTLSHWTIRSWLNTGKLRGTRVGVRRVIRESELKKLIVDDPRRPQTSGAKTRRHASA